MTTISNATQTKVPQFTSNILYEILILVHKNIEKKISC